ncbi:MAG: ribosome silencing factor [Mariprofundales bacterium]
MNSTLRDDNTDIIDVIDVIDVTDSTESTNKETSILINALMSALEETKCLDLCLLDVRGQSPVTDYMIIASATSTRHLKGLANIVSQTAHKADFSVNIEGLDGMEWLLIDLVDVVIHLFLPETRAAFALENLWGKGTLRPSS